MKFSDYLKNNSSLTEAADVRESTISIAKANEGREGKTLLDKYQKERPGCIYLGNGEYAKKGKNNSVELYLEPTGTDNKLKRIYIYKDQLKIIKDNF